MADNYRRYGAYVDGSAARVVTMPEREPVYRPGKERRRDDHRKKSTERKVRKKVSLFSVSITMISIVLVFYMCVSYVMVYSDLLANQKQVAALEGTVADMRADNDEAYASIDSSVNMKDVYKKATKKLGMVHAKAGQVYSYDDKRSDRVIQYSDIPEGK